MGACVSWSLWKSLASRWLKDVWKDVFTGSYKGRRAGDFQECEHKATLQEMVQPTGVRFFSSEAEGNMGFRMKLRSKQHSEV